MMHTDKSIEFSPASLTHKLVKCFNLCSSLTRDCQGLGSELRELLSMLDQYIVRTNEQEAIFSSRYKQVIECLLQIKEHLDGVSAQSIEKSSVPSLAEAIQAIRVMVENCLSSQKIKVMEDPVGQMIKPGYHSTEGITPVAHGSPPGTIVSVLQPGYIQQHGDREIVIRPATVQVSGGAI